MDRPVPQDPRFPLDDERRQLVLHARPALRGETTATRLIDPENEVECRICRIRVVSNEDDRIVMSFGLRIRASTSALLRWARLRITPVSDGVAVTSGFPRAVLIERSFDGLIRFSPSAELELMDLDGDSSAVPNVYDRFGPFIIAGKIGNRGVFWDFHAIDGALPSGADRLLFAASGPRGMKASFEVSAFVSVAFLTGPDGGARESLLEMPSYVQAIELEGGGGLVPTLFS